MEREIDILRRKAEEDKKQMEEQHKRDLEAMQMHAKEAAHSQRVLAYQMALTEKLWALESRCEAMKHAATEMRQKYELERQQFEKEKEQHAQRVLEEVSGQAKLQATMHCKQCDEQKVIIKKQEGKVKALEMAVQDQKKKLMERQQLEQQVLELQRQHEKEMNRIYELEDDQVDLQEMANALVQKERIANDFLEEARKAAVQVLDKYGKRDTIDNKLMGTIDERPWKAICKKKFKHHKDHPYGWERTMIAMISEWEVRMKDEAYHPFKNINLGGGEFKRIIDQDEPHLKKLKEDMGEEVMQSVATAFLEIEEYNASGRYPIMVAWNFQKNERVQLKDLLLYLKELLDAPGKAKKKRGRAMS